MAKIFNEINIKKTSKGKIVLNHLELFYLRLYTHGFSDNKISVFLEIEKRIVNAIKQQLQKKYNTEIWEVIIKKAFHSGILKKSDFIDQIIKEEALTCAKHIFNDNIKVSQIKITTLKLYIKDYYNSCEKRLLKVYKAKPQKDKLTKYELRFINLTFKNTDKDVIAYELNVFISSLETIKNTVFAKMQVCNWFNAFKYAYQFGLLDKDALSANSKIFMDIYARKIKLTFERKTLGELEKKLMVYNLLLDLYASVEFENLLNIEYNS